MFAEEHWQEFSHGDSVVEIRVLPGTATTNNQPFILLSDVQDVFPEAVRFRNGKRAVSFMVDCEGERLMPLKVAYQSGVVMEVVLARSTASSWSLATTSSPVHTPSEAVIEPANHEAQHHDSAPEYPAYDISPVPDYSASICTPFTQLRRIATDPPPSMYATPVTPAGTRTHVHQPLTPELRERIFDTDDLSSEQLVDIQTRVESILSKAFEIYELSVPWLFIVLPKDASNWDPEDIFNNQFRLFFLCDCGAHMHHTRAAVWRQDSKIEHRIHLASHQGYDLQSPHQFLRQFGSQVLSLLQMFRYGISASGYEVPSLELLGLAPEIADLPALSEGIEVAVYRAIEIIQKLLGYSEGWTATPPLGTNHLKAQDYQLVHKYLPDQDYATPASTETAGGLCRILTPEGHVKWICEIHCQATARVLPTVDERNRLLSQGGILNDKMGMLSVALYSKYSAVILYPILVSTKCILELHLSIQGPESQKDLRDLASTLEWIRGVVYVTLTTNKSGNGINIFGKNKRPDPILQEIINLPRLRAFTLSGMDGFMSRATVFPWISHLRSLSLNEIHLPRQIDSSTATIFRNCPKLKELSLGCSELQAAFSSVQEAIESLNAAQKIQFERLTLTTALIDTVIIDYSHGRMVSMDVSSQSQDLPEFVNSYGMVRRLEMKTVALNRPADADLVRILGLRDQMYLQDLKLQCRPEQFPTMYELIRDVDLQRREQKGFSLMQSLVLWFSGSELTVSDLQNPASMSLTLEYNQSTATSLVPMMVDLGFALERLTFSHTTISPSNAIDIYNKLWESLLKSSDQYGGFWRLKQLHLCLSSVSSDILDNFAGIVMNSVPNLQTFSVAFIDGWNLDPINHYVWAEWLGRTCAKITDLNFQADPQREMLLMEKICLMKFSRLKKLRVAYPSSRFLSSTGFLHLWRFLETITETPDSTPTEPAYLSAAIKASQADAIYPRRGATSIHMLALNSLGASSSSFSSLPLPGPITGLASLSSALASSAAASSSSTYRVWTAPKTSPQFTRLYLENIYLGPVGWTSLFDVIDFPVMLELGFRGRQTRLDYGHFFYLPEHILQYCKQFNDYNNSSNSSNNSSNNNSGSSGNKFTISATEQR
ncbi:hypothetical protein BGZ98_001408 [Dissophora globulifera]|nr:hypothetical protein BGZ98_001408 [Dissophora globulifera]